MDTDTEELIAMMVRPARSLRRGCDEVSLERTISGEIGVVGKIEAFEPGGVTRDDTHRVLVSDYPFYVRPCNLIKLAVLPEYTP